MPYCWSLFALHIQVWALLLRNECRVSDSQVTVQTCGPLVQIGILTCFALTKWDACNTVYPANKRFDHHANPDRDLFTCVIKSLNMQRITVLSSNACLSLVLQFNLHESFSRIAIITLELWNSFSRIVIRSHDSHKSSSGIAIRYLDFHNLFFLVVIRSLRLHCVNWGNEF